MYRGGKRPDVEETEEPSKGEGEHEGGYRVFLETRVRDPSRRGWCLPQWCSSVAVQDTPVLHIVLIFAAVTAARIHLDVV